MSKVRIYGDVSGYLDIAVPDNSGTTTSNLAKIPQADINGNIAISVERVKENAKDYNCDFRNEMLRVMVHGLLHFMGFNDKTKKQKFSMKKAENEKINMFHVEH